MKLTPAQVRQVQRGEKTEHRVLIVGEHEVRRPAIQGRTGRVQRAGLSATYTTRTRKPEIGDSLVIRSYEPATETRDEIEEVRVQVIAVARETLQNLTAATANAEGWETVEDFQDAWMRRHDPGYPPLEEGLCSNCGGHKHYENHQGDEVECDQCDEVGTVLVPSQPDADVISERFERRHAHHLVYALTFIHQTDVSTWLHRRHGHSPTTSIGEALDPSAPLLGEPSKQWREKAERHHRDALQFEHGARLADLTTDEARLLELARMAREAGVDITGTLRTIERKVHTKTMRRAA